MAEPREKSEVEASVKPTEAVEAGEESVSEESVSEESVSEESVGEVEESGEVSPPTWRELWQAPALIGSVALLGTAGYLAFSGRAEVSYSDLLRHGEVLLESGKPLEAIDDLNTRVFPYEAKGELPEAARAQYYLLLGRAMYLGQRELEVDSEENHERILSAFADSEAHGGELGDQDREAIARTHLALGHSELAAAAAGRIGDAHADRRQELIKRAVELELSGSVDDYGPALAMLQGLLDDPKLDTPGRAWIARQQTRVLIEQGYLEQGIAKLLRELQRLGDLDPSTRADLLLILAQAYLDVGTPVQANRQLDAIEGLLVGSDDRMGEVLWLRGLALDSQGDAQGARETLLAVLAEYPSSDSALAALFEVGQIEAKLDEPEASAHHFGRLVELLLEGRTHPRVERASVVESLLARSAEVGARLRWDLSLTLARLAESLMVDTGDVEPEVLLAIAWAERGSALDLMGLDEDLIGELDGRVVMGVMALDPATREEARRHLIAAGSMYLRHARTQVVDDYEAFGRSLFLAADSFDRAGDQGEAIQAFQEFSDAFPGDPRRAEARFRLAQAFEARGEEPLAVEAYRSLIADAKDPQTKNVGVFGDLSYVPLARLLGGDGDAENDAEAEALLREIVDGTVVRDPDTALFRDGLYEFGSFLARSGRNEEAIAVLGEAAVRLEGDRREIEVRYRLADALRRDAARIATELERAIPPREREALEAVRVGRLESARGMFEQTIEAIGLIEERRLGLARREMLRNSMYFRADCELSLGNHERAIELYDEAYSKYPEDPASLVALTQIVTIRLEQGDISRAMASNDRARRFFESLPEDVWDDPYLPMGRAEWESWLSATSALAMAGVDEDVP